MPDAPTSLADYARNRSEEAFRQLVSQYVDLVYSTALRLVAGDSHRAQDVTQLVFAGLAQKARLLDHNVNLGGWLHRHTCFVAANLMRGERRRLSREKEAVAMKALQDHPEADFTAVAPLLDDAINQLGDHDRAAIMLRFFEQRDFRSVGEALGSNEDAARVRVARALDKLRARLNRQGIATSSGALSVVLVANAVHAAPAGLASTASHAALAAGTTLLPAKAIALTALHKALIAGGLAVLVSAGVFVAQQSHVPSRPIATATNQTHPPSVEDMRQLFRLATVDQPRIRIKADITEFEKPWTAAQMAAELAEDRKDLIAEGGKPTAQWEIAQSNAIARSHFGSRVYHVQEWYSTNHHSRVDSIDEASATPTWLSTNLGNYTETYVNIDDPSFSEYRSFHVVRTLRDLELNRSNLWGRNELWAATGLEQVGMPVVLALLDVRTLPKTNFQSITSYSQVGARVDEAHLESLHAGTNRLWQMLADDDRIGDAICTRIKLTQSAEGQKLVPGFANVEFVFWLTRYGTNTLCIQALTTNLTSHDSFITERSNFDENGYPRLWKRTTITNGVLQKRTEVVFQEIELHPTFTDQEIFSPVFPPDYEVYDITSGVGVTLQKRTYPKPIPRTATPH